MNPSRAPDMIGQTFGRWTVEAIAAPSDGAYVHARCACGTKRVVQASSLRLGKSKSCRCLSVPALVGQTIGRWSVLEHIGPKSYFRVRCNLCQREREMYSSTIYGTCGHTRCLCKTKAARR